MFFRHLLTETQGQAGTFRTYKEIADKVGVFHRTIKGALYYIQDRCRERGLPTLTVWVVRKDSGLPGLGCDVIERDEVQQTAEKTRTINWPPEPWW